MSPENKYKILIVDDEITVGKSIRRAIESEAYAIDTALSGEEALSMDDSHCYDLIISDLMMPGISGLELLESMKVRRPQAKVIMITGYPTIKTAVQAIQLGAFDYIPKPFTPKELRSLVSRAVTASSPVSEMTSSPRKSPPGLYCMIGHTWLKLEGPNKALIGVEAAFTAAVADITGLELPLPNTEIAQGEVCATLADSSGFTHRIWAPAGGRVIESNPILAEDYALLKNDPYGEGWLFRMEPVNMEEDIKGLVLSK